MPYWKYWVNKPFWTDWPRSEPTPGQRLALPARYIN